MADRHEARTIPPIATRQFQLGFGLGAVLGAVLALTAVWFSNALQPQSAPDDVQATKRWFIWQGSAPLLGQSFSSQAQCEEERKALVANRQRDLENRAKAISRMTIHQAVALGESPGKLLDEASKLDAAYCRASE